VSVLDDREAYEISCHLETHSAAAPSPSAQANHSHDSKLKKKAG
jgi:hypothetical protein